MDVDVELLEKFFVGLLMVASVVIAWFAGYVVYKLFKD